MFSYIEKQNGKLVRKKIEVQINEGGSVQFNSTATHSLPFNVLKHHYIPNQESLVEVIKRNGKYFVYNTKVRELEKYDAEHKDTVNYSDPKEKDNTDLNDISKARYTSAYEDVDTNSALYNLFTKGEYASTETKQSNLVKLPKKRKKKTKQ